MFLKAGEPPEAAPLPPSVGSSPNGGLGHRVVAPVTSGPQLFTANLLLLLLLCTIHAGSSMFCLSLMSREGRLRPLEGGVWEPEGVCNTAENPSAQTDC